MFRAYPNLGVIQVVRGPPILKAQAGLDPPKTATATKRVFAVRNIRIHYLIRITRYASRSWLPSTETESTDPGANRCEPTSVQVPRSVDHWT